MASLSGPWSGLAESDNLWLMAGVFGLLSIASLVGWWLAVRTAGGSESARRTVANLNARLRAWWVIVVGCTLALLLGRAGAAALFGLVSFLALREFVALVPVRPIDRMILLWTTWTLLPSSIGWRSAGGTDCFPCSSRSVFSRWCRWQ